MASATQQGKDHALAIEAGVTAKLAQLRGSMPEVPVPEACGAQREVLEFCSFVTRESL